MAKIALSTLLVMQTAVITAALTVGDDSSPPLQNTCYEGTGNCLWKGDDACGWNGGECAVEDAQCYYPTGKVNKLTPVEHDLGVETNYEERYDPRPASAHRTLFFQSRLCSTQQEGLTRFDGEKLSLEPVWASCIRSFYKVAVQNTHLHEIEIQSPRISPSSYLDGATGDQISELEETCRDVSTEFSGGNEQIVLFVANTPRKLELENWMAHNANVRVILSKYMLSGTATTVNKLKETFHIPNDRFITSSLHTESGPKGGDIQGAALMATGRVRALFFFQSYATECHRCDIQAMVEICLGAKNRYNIGCAFTVTEANALAEQLVKEANGAQMA